MATTLSLRQIKRMRSARYLSSAIVIALLLEQPLVASMYVGSSSFVHPRIASGQMTVHSACILPVKGEVVQIPAFKRQPDLMAIESAQWSEALQRMSESRLKTAGIDTTPAAHPYSPADFTEKKFLNQQQSFDAISPQLEKKPKNIAKDSYTLGTDVAKAACATSSDVLIFVEAEYRFPTVGRAVLGTLVRAPQTDSVARFNLALVDAKSGEVVGFLHIENVMPHFDDADRTFGAAFDKELQKMNLSSAASHP
jgi:hypothetical protein